MFSKPNLLILFLSTFSRAFPSCSMIQSLNFCIPVTYKISLFIIFFLCFICLSVQQLQYDILRSYYECIETRQGLSSWWSSSSRITFSPWMAKYPYIRFNFFFKYIPFCGLVPKEENDLLLTPKPSSFVPWFWDWITITIIKIRSIIAGISFLVWYYSKSDHTLENTRLIKRLHELVRA